MIAGKDILFLIFAVITVGGASLVIFAKKITYAAFSLMLSLFGLAGLYVFLSADFIAAVQVIIYVGGILVLLLFGVLLTSKISGAQSTTLKNQRVWAALTVAGLFVVIFAIISKSPWLTGTAPIAVEPKSEKIGELLMTDYLLPFEIASVLLLAALIGALFIVRSEHK